MGCQTKPHQTRRSRGARPAPRRAAGRDGHCAPVRARVYANVDARACACLAWPNHSMHSGSDGHAVVATRLRENSFNTDERTKPRHHELTVASVSRQQRHDAFATSLPAPLATPACRRRRRHRRRRRRRHLLSCRARRAPPTSHSRHPRPRLRAL